jgi:hypothetical protein
MSFTELEQKILQSPSWRSFKEERDVKRLLSRLGWRAVHGCFYTDLETQKPREIDVVARKSWERKTKRYKLSGQLMLVVECKSVSGFHVLISPIPERHVELQRVWKGEYKYEVLIAKALREKAITQEQISKIMTMFRKRAYPTGFGRPRKMFVDPMSSPYHGGAFREHNIGSEKDLENSVVWKAQKSLFSALRSFEAEIIENCLADLSGMIECAREMREDIVRAVIGDLDFELNYVQLYHPVVVLKSQLWTIEKERPKQIEWCRFHRLNDYGLSNWWFDLVTADSFASYARKVTEHYAKAYHKVGAKPVR